MARRRWPPFRSLRRGIDVVFLDLQMPGLDGFELIEAVGKRRMPPVVFVTAHDEHALRAFEVQAVDYILKPVDEARLRRALSRLAPPNPGSIERLCRELAHMIERERDAPAAFPVRDGERTIFVPVDTVDVIRAEVTMRASSRESGLISYGTRWRGCTPGWIR